MSDHPYHVPLFRGEFEDNRQQDDYTEALGNSQSRGSAFSIFRRQFMALVRKNLLMMWRRKFLLAVQLLFPSLCLLVLFMARSTRPPADIATPSMAPFDIPSLKDVIYSPSNNPNDYDLSKSYFLAFTPVNPDTEEVMKAFANNNDLTWNVDVKGMRMGKNEPGSEPWAGMELKTHNGLPGDGVIQFVVYFSSGPRGYLSDQVHYVIMTREVPTTWRGSIDDQRPHMNFPFSSPDFYQTQFNGTLAVQRALDEAIIQMKTGKPTSIKVSLDPFKPYIPTSRPSDPWGSRGKERDFGNFAALDASLPLFLLAGTMLAFIMTVYTVMAEKGNGTLELLRSMGLVEGAYWLAWYTVHVLVYIVALILVLVVGVVSGNPYFKYARLFALFFPMIFFGCCMIALGLVSASCFQRSRNGYIFALLVLVSVFLPAVLMIIHAQSFYTARRPWGRYWVPSSRYQMICPTDDLYMNPVWTYGGYTYKTNPLVYGLNLLPGYHFARMFDIITATVFPSWYEKGHNEPPAQYPSQVFTAALISKPRVVLLHEDRALTVANVGSSMGLLFVLTYTYLIAAWYFGQVFRGSNRKGERFWFPCLPSYWRRNRTNTFYEHAVGDTLAELQKESKARNSIILHHASKTFKTTTALHEVSLKVNRDEILCLLGPNGAGKSTLVGLLSGRLSLTLGNAFVSGFDLKKDMHHLCHMLSVCPQNDVLWPELSAEDHLQFFARFKNVENRQEVVNALLHQVSLDDTGTKKAGNFSGGMKRRLSVAISCIGDPDILVLDEPTTGLDPLSRQKVWVLIEKMKHRRVVLLTTHSMEEADTIGDRIAILSKGRVRADGTASFLKNRFGSGYQATLQCDPQDIQSLRRVIEAGLPRAEVLDDSAGALVVSIPRNATRTHMTALFRLVQGKRKSRLIREWGVSYTTLEEVFLRLSQETRVVNQELSSNVAADNTLSRLCTICCKRDTETVVLYTQGGLPVEASNLVCASCAVRPKDADDNDVGDATGAQAGAAIAPDLKSDAGDDDDDDDDETLAARDEGIHLVGASESQPLAEDRTATIRKGQSTNKSQFRALLYKWFTQKRRQRKLNLIQFLLPFLAWLTIGILCATQGIAIWSDTHSHNRCVWSDRYGPSESGCTAEDYAELIQCEHRRSGGRYPSLPCPAITDQSSYYLSCFNSTSGIFIGQNDLKLPIWQGASEPARDSRDLLYIPQGIGVVNKVPSGDDSPSSLFTSMSPMPEELISSRCNSTLTQDYYFRTIEHASDAAMQGAVLLDQENRYRRYPDPVNGSWVRFGVHFNRLNTVSNQLDYALFSYLGHDVRDAEIYPVYPVTNDYYQSSATDRNSLILTSYMSSLHTAFYRKAMGKDFGTEISTRIKPWPMAGLPYGATPFEFSDTLKETGAKEERSRHTDRFYKLLISSVFVFTTLLLLPAYTGIAVMEREKRCFDLMIVMGVKVRLYWMSYGIFGAIMYSAVAIWPLILGYPLSIYPIKSHVPFVWLALVILWGVFLFGCSMVIVTCFQKGRLATIVSYCFIFVCLVVAIGSNAIMSTFDNRLLVMAPVAITRSFYVLFSPSAEGTTKMYAIYFSLLINAALANALAYFAFLARSTACWGWSRSRKNKSKNAGTTVINYSPTLGPEQTLETGLTDATSLGSDGDLEEDVVAERELVQSHNLPDDTLLVIDGLRKEYGEQTAVKGLYLHARKGECLGLLGPNGAGKTTTISCLIGEQLPTSGDAFITDVATGSPLSCVAGQHEIHEKGAVGVCLQFDALWPDLTVEEHLYFYARLKGADKLQERAVVQQAAQLVELAGDPFQQKTGLLAGGQQRMLSLAIAFIGSPSVVLLDEPTTGMDPEVRRRAWSIIANANRDRTIVLTTHSMEEADTLCSRIGMMNHGTLQCIGTPLRLKRKFGQGHRLSVTVPNTTIQGRPAGDVALEYVETHIPEAKLSHMVTGHLTFALGTAQTNLPHLLERMTADECSAFIEDWSFSESSLADVFVKIARS